MTMQFDPPLLSNHTVLVTVVVFGALLALFLRRPRTTWTVRRAIPVGIRALLATALLVILCNPTTTSKQNGKAAKPFYVVLLDASRSMREPDVGGISRFVQAKRQTVENRAWMSKLSTDFDMRCAAFAGKPEVTTVEALTRRLKPDGDRTDLGTALTGSVAELGPEARRGGHILLVSDGRDTPGGFPLEAARTARAQGFMVSTLCLGQSTRQRDVRVVCLRPQVYAVPGQVVQLAVDLRSTGVRHHQTHVDLLQDGRRVAARRVLLDPGSREVRFPLRHSRQGLYRYTVAVAPLPGERDTTNNRATVFLNVLDARARVLFLEGRPSWDAKFLANALRVDPTVTVDVIYKLTDSRFFAVLGGASRAGIAIPRTMEEMTRYDLIVFGKGFEEFYDDAGARALKAWVMERGGNVVFLRGRADERTAILRELEPVDWSEGEVTDLRLRLTEEGRAHPGFAFTVSPDAQTVVRHLPSLITASRVRGEKAMAVVLARAENTLNEGDAREMATVAWMRYGQGKVMTITGEGLWRWAFLPSDFQAHRRVFEEFWTQTVRWMVSDSDFLPGQSVSIHADRMSYPPGETVRLSVSHRGRPDRSAPVVTMTQPDSRVIRVTTAAGGERPANFTAVFHPSMPGEYVAMLPGRRSGTVPAMARFTVLPDHEEDINRSADPDLMRRIASAGGGQTLAPGDIAGQLERSGAKFHARTRVAEPRSAWDRSWVLATLLALLIGEWWLRRRWGLA